MKNISFSKLSPEILKNLILPRGNSFFDDFCSRNLNNNSQKELLSHDTKFSENKFERKNNNNDSNDNNDCNDNTSNNILNYDDVDDLAITSLKDNLRDILLDIIVV